MNNDRRRRSEPAPPARFAVGVLVPATALGPLPPGMGHQVERSEPVQADHHLGLVGPGYDLTVGNRAEVLDAGLLGGVVRIAGGLPGLHALKADAFLAEQDAQALVADVRSVRGALPALLLVAFPELPPESGVPDSEHRGSPHVPFEGLGVLVPWRARAKESLLPGIGSASCAPWPDPNRAMSSAGAVHAAQPLATALDPQFLCGVQAGRTRPESAGPTGTGARAPADRRPNGQARSGVTELVSSGAMTGPAAAPQPEARGSSALPRLLGPKQRSRTTGADARSGRMSAGDCRGPDRERH